MARGKKNDEVAPDTTATVVEPVATELPMALPESPTDAPPPDQPTEPPPQAQPVNGNGNGSRKPVMSWRFPAASGVTIEVALWPHQITLQTGEVIDVLNVTVTRNYKDNTGQWCKGGSHRVSELPVLMHALQKAHAYALDARAQNG